MSNTQVSVFTDLLEKVLGGTELLFITKGKTGVNMQSTSNGSVAVVRVPTLEIAGLKDVPIELDLKSFTGAAKGRNVTIEFSSHNVVIKSGKSYVATIAAGESGNAPAIMPQEENTTKVRLTDEHKQFLNKALALTKIEKTYSGITDTLVYIEATEKALTIACFEARQIAYVMVKNTIAFPVCSIVLPSGVIQKVNVLQGDVVIEVSESTSLFKSKLVDLQVPLPIDTVNAIKREAVMDIIKKTKAEIKVLETSLIVQVSDLTSFVENAQAITQTGTEVIIKPGVKNGVVLSVTTPKGKVEEKFPGTVVTPFALDFAFVKAALARSKESVEVRLSESFAIVAGSEVTYIAALSEMAAE